MPSGRPMRGPIDRGRRGTAREHSGAGPPRRGSRERHVAGVSRPRRHRRNRPVSFTRGGWTDLCARSRLVVVVEVEGLQLWGWERWGRAVWAAGVM